MNQEDVEGFAEATDQQNKVEIEHWLHVQHQQLTAEFEQQKVVMLERFDAEIADLHRRYGDDATFVQKTLVTQVLTNFLIF